MKKLTLIITLVMSIFNVCSSQIIVDSKFIPFSYEELCMQAAAKAKYDRQQKAYFEYYQDKAYECYNNEDLYGFLTYSNYALDTGWYNAELYYYRGVAYERLFNFKEAKKNYKKAKKNGYALAERALSLLKDKEKEYKRMQKEQKNK